MIPAKQRCLGGGYLVDGQHPLPEDLTEYFGDRRRHQLVGCNRLRCLRCGQMVQNVVSGTTRRYLCECAGWLETAVRPTSVIGVDGAYDDAHLPWRCAGHPTVTRSISVSGPLA